MSRDLQAEEEVWQRQQAEAEFARQQHKADMARAAWEARQLELRDAVPADLWGRAQDAWGSDLLPWEIGAFGQLVRLFCTALL